MAPSPFDMTVEDDGARTLKARRASVRGGGSSKSSLMTSVLNLSKNIIGAGMLALPFAMKGAGVLPFLFGTLAAGAINAYTFFLIGWCCHEVGATTFGELWLKTLGPGTAWVADVSVLLNNGLACVSYCVLTGDFMTKVNEGLLPSYPWLQDRSLVLVVVGATLLAPLSLLTDLSMLSISSMAGLVVTFYGFLLLVADAAASGGLADADGHVLQNWFPMRMDFFAAFALFNSAFMAHYNSPKFYTDLEDNTLPRFGRVVLGAFSIALVVFTIFGFAGFVLFGFNVNGNVLTNYDATTKVLLAWLGMAFSVIFTYPLVFSTFRDAAFATLVRTGVVGSTGSSEFHVLFTLAAVGGTVFCGINLTNVATVMGLKGAIFSACLAFIFPALFHLQLTGPGGRAAGNFSPLMRAVDKGLLAAGVLSGVLALLVMFVLKPTDFTLLVE